jgi:hypothetical protein
MWSSIGTTAGLSPAAIVLKEITRFFKRAQYAFFFALRVRPSRSKTCFGALGEIAITLARLLAYRLLSQSRSQIALNPIDLPTTNAKASASVSRTVLEVSVCRSPCLKNEVRHFVHERGELGGKDADGGPAPHTERGDNARVKLKRDALSDDVFAQTVEIHSRLARRLLQLRQRYALGLRLVPHVYLAKAKQRGPAGAGFAGALCLVLAGLSDQRGEDGGDAFLAPLDSAAELIPRPQARDVRGLWPLSRNGEDIA